MVRTRSGNEVFHTEASYGRAARSESTRQRKKRKAGNAENSAGSTMTPRRTLTTRSQIRHEAALATPPSASIRVGTTPSPKAERLLRANSTSRKPRCSDFGTARHFAFKGQGYYFCSSCDLWDDLPPDMNKKVSMNSLQFGCKANHAYYSHPTTLRKEDCYVRRRRTLVIPPANRVTSRTSPTSIDNHILDSTSESEESNHSSSATSTCRSSVDLGLDVETQHGYADNHTADGNHDDESSSITNNNQPPATSMNAVVASNCIIQGPTFSDHEEDRTPLLLRAQVEQLKGKIGFLQERNRRLLIENKALRHEAGLKVLSRTSNNDASHESHNVSAPSRNEAFINDVLEAVNDVLGRYKRWSDNRVGQLVAKALWRQDKFLPHFLRCSRKHFRENIFTSCNILREMDLAGGTLSYEGIDVLRRVETRGVKRFRGSVIPSKSELKRMAGVVEWFAQEHCPFESQQTTTGESVQFNYSKSMLCITKAFHLDKIGKSRSLSVASSIDGASLSKNLSIIAGGIKITDRAARCPVTSRPLLDNPFTMSAQSRNLCIPLKIMMGRETKDTFTEFGSLFTFLDNLSDKATLPTEMAGFFPFSCMTNCDLSAQWKGMCKGGAAKVHTLPCTGCATESDMLATPNAITCTRWCMDHSMDPDWMCFHKQMATPERVESMKAEVTELLATLERALVEVLAESRMTRCDAELDAPPDSSLNNTTSIHFCPENATQRQSLSRLLTNELMLRGLNINGTLEMRRERLRLALKGEATIARLSKEIEHGKVKEGAYFLLMTTLPCILHMENRNGIKILSMLLIEGLSNAKKKLMYTEVNEEGTRVSRFVSDIENLINTSILGTRADPCQWMCPFDFKKKELGPITMDNVRTRRILDSLDDIVDMCIMDNVRKGLWMTALNNYRTSLVLLRRKDDFTNEMIATYQCHADKFFQAWVRLWQKEGITNYIHMIGSGHIADYLFKWNNLYRFSQQGWEAMNSLIKTFFFRRTSHGGGVRGASKKSRLIPIARWLQRRMVFLCRINEHTIGEYIAEHPMPQSFRTQALLRDNVYE